MKYWTATAICWATMVSSPVLAQNVPISDIWDVCDLAMLDRGFDPPLAAKFEQFRMQPGEDGSTLQVIATGADGEAMFCEIETTVKTFRVDTETYVSD